MHQCQRVESRFLVPERSEFLFLEKQCFSSRKMSFRTLKFGDRTISYDAGLDLVEREGETNAVYLKIISIFAQTFNSKIFFKFILRLLF